MLLHHVRLVEAIDNARAASQLDNLHLTLCFLDCGFFLVTAYALQASISGLSQHVLPSGLSP